jgi:uncharacterized protein
MNRIVQFAVFLSIFYTVFFGMHYYIGSRLTRYLGWQRNWVYYALLFLLPLTFILFNVISRSYHNGLVRALYGVSSAWLGIMFFSLFLFLAYEFVRIFYKGNTHAIALSIIAVVATISIFAIIAGQIVTVKRIQVPFDAKLKAVQLSDIHVGSVHNSGYLKGIVEKTNAQKPDVVFITGDLVDGSAPMHEGMFDELKGLNAPAYLVLGNHEYYEGVPEFLEIFKSTKIPVLRDEAVEFNGIQIVGADYKDERGNGTRKYLASIDYSKPTIVLNHIPVGVEEMRSGVMLSGHTHNGQIYPWNIFVSMAFKYVHGLYNVGDAQIYVSPGTGTWGPPMRLGSFNQITLLEFG